MRIDAEAAREYYQHKSQRRGTFHPNDLHDNGILYHAAGGVCLAFHRVYWPGVWMVHLAAKPEAWGSVAGTCLALFREFADIEKPVRIIGWTPKSLRAAIALNKRIGMTHDGSMDVGNDTIEIYGWRP